MSSEDRQNNLSEKQTIFFTFSKIFRDSPKKRTEYGSLPHPLHKKYRTGTVSTRPFSFKNVPYTGQKVFECPINTHNNACLPDVAHSRHAAGQAVSPYRFSRPFLRITALPIPTFKQEKDRRSESRRSSFLQNRKTSAPSTAFSPSVPKLSPLSSALFPQYSTSFREWSMVEESASPHPRFCRPAPLYFFGQKTAEPCQGAIS